MRMKVAMLKNVNSKLQRNFMGSIVDIRNSLEQFQRDVLGRQDEIRQEYEAQVGELVSRFKKVRREVSEGRSGVWTSSGRSERRWRTRVYGRN